MSGLRKPLLGNPALDALGTVSSGLVSLVEPVRTGDDIPQAV